MDKIVGLGNALVDVLAALENDTPLKEMELPKGSMQLVDEDKLRQINDNLAKMETHLASGGSAANTIMGLACLGATTGFIGKVGHDRYGDFFRQHLGRNHIDDKLLASPSLPSGVASTFISPDGERTFGTYLGAAATLEANDLTPAMFEGYTYLYIEGYLVQNHDMILRALHLAKAAGLRVCLDLASYNIVAADRDFFGLLVDRYVDILFANEEEARAFTGQEPLEALARLAARCDIAVVKVGAAGSYASRAGQTVHADAIPVPKVIDTTGAGDYFAAGFLYALIHGHPLRQCAEVGALLSGNVIQVVGTTMTAERWTEIKLNIKAILAE
ncbi:MAG: adenosine kinase [Mediterranea sp.]|jgi:sugar/nucleoside kinase (ribokinase family)|nr:adenosine kinase [Mediterranea sp.]